MLKKIAVVALLVMIGSTAAMSSAAAQGPPQPMSGSITVDEEGTTTELVRVAGRVMFFHVESQVEMDGDLKGEATGSYTQILHPAGFVNPAGTVVCECEIDGVEGTVVIRTRVIVNFVTEDVRGGGTVISADGDLAGLRSQSQLFPIPENEKPTFGYTGKTHFAGQ